jgi:hypothetical protein
VLRSLPEPMWTTPSVTAHSRRGVFLPTLVQLQQLHIGVNAKHQVNYESCLRALSTRLFHISLQSAYIAASAYSDVRSFDTNEFLLHHHYAASKISEWWAQSRQQWFEHKLKSEASARVLAERRDEMLRRNVVERQLDDERRHRLLVSQERKRLSHFLACQKAVPRQHQQQDQNVNPTANASNPYTSPMSMAMPSPIPPVPPSLQSSPRSAFSDAGVVVTGSLKSDTGEDFFEDSLDRTHSDESDAPWEVVDDIQPASMWEAVDSASSGGQAWQSHSISSTEQNSSVATVEWQ